MPGYPDAVLSTAAADLAAGEATRAEEALRGLLADRRAGPTDRARAHTLLGDVLDRAARYGEAFDAYAAGNELTRQMNARFAQPSVLEYTRGLSTTFTALSARWRPAAPAPAAAAAAAGEPADHVLLMGFPRSGTTLLEVILDGHPKVASLEEHELFTEGVLQFLNNPGNLDSLCAAGDSELAPLRAAYWQRVRAAGIEVSGKLFLDKHPLNTLKLPLIARLFPQAKILFVRRDPRDVVLSCFRRRFRMNPAMYQMLTLPGAAQFYDAVMDFAARVRAPLGLAWCDVSYEGLMADFAAETQRICRFAGLDWSAGMSEFATRVQSRESATPEHRTAGARPGSLRHRPLAPLQRSARAGCGDSGALGRSDRDRLAGGPALPPRTYLVRCARKLRWKGVVIRYEPSEARRIVFSAPACGGPPASR